MTTESHGSRRRDPAHRRGFLFHRAHQAWYLHKLIDSGDTRWSLTVGNIRGDMNAVLEALARAKTVFTRWKTVTPQGRAQV